MLAHQGDNRQASPPALLVDAMLGRLARWLRLLGWDTEYWRSGPDEALISAAQAAGRLIVTRDRALARRRGVRVLLIEPNGPRNNWQRSARRWGPDPRRSPGAVSAMGS